MSIRILKNDITRLVHDERIRANEKFPLFSSDHEGYAVIKEEFEEAAEDLDICGKTIDEMWNRVKNNRDLNDNPIALSQDAVLLACEAVQLAAMADKMIESEMAKKHPGISEECNLVMEGELNVKAGGKK